VCVEHRVVAAHGTERRVYVRADHMRLCTTRASPTRTRPRRSAIFIAQRIIGSFGFRASLNNRRVRVGHMPWRLCAQRHATRTIDRQAAREIVVDFKQRVVFD
jgi:hypothetical protein